MVRVLRQNEIPYAQRERALTKWHRREKRRRPFAGLQFWTPCNDGTHNIAARHWPSSLTWSWIVAFQRYWKKDGVSTTIWPTKARAWLPYLRAMKGQSGFFSWGPIRVSWQAEMPYRSRDDEAEDRFVAALADGPSHPQAGSGNNG